MTTDQVVELKAQIYGQPVKVALGTELACCICACCDDEELHDIEPGVLDYRQVELPIWGNRPEATVLCVGCLQLIAAEAAQALLEEAKEYGVQAAEEYEASLT